MDAHARLDPTSPAVPRDVGPSARVLTVAEAAQLYKFPLDRLLRKLAAGGVPGAFKRTGGGTQEWCIPENSLTALGYSPAEAAPPQETPAHGAGVQGPPAGEVPDGLGQLAGELRRQAAAELAELKAEREELDAERLELAAERQELEIAFATIEEYRAALEAETARFEKLRSRIDERGRTLAADRRRLTAESKRLEAETFRLAQEREELSAARQQVEDELLEVRRRTPPGSRSAPGERPSMRRRKTPGAPSGY